MSHKNKTKHLPTPPNKQTTTNQTNKQQVFFLPFQQQHPKEKKNKNIFVQSNVTDSSASCL